MDCPAILMEWSVTEDYSLGGAAAGSADFSAGFASFSWPKEFAGAMGKRKAAAHSRGRRVAKLIFQFFLETRKAAYWNLTHFYSFLGARGFCWSGISLWGY